MIKQKILFLSVLLVLANIMYAQGEIKKKRSLSDKVFFGAGLGMQFGTITAIEVSPTIGYIPVDKLYLGLRGTYEYYKNNQAVYDNNSTSIYGGSLFATYAFYQNFLLYGEYEMLSLESAYFDPFYVQGDKERFLLKTPLIGAGYMQPLGGRSKVMLLLLWNLDETYGLYYDNPIMRISFIF